MTRTDHQLLFTALGFLAVVMKGEDTKKDGAKRATALAGLIESFCYTTVPDAFENFPEMDGGMIDQMIDWAKAKMGYGEPAKLPDNRNLMIRMYRRLQERHRRYATDDLMADEIVHLLEEEIKHKAEANMMIVSVQGNPDVFAPCERMATAIAEVLKTKGECFPADIESKFTAEEIKRHWRMAYSLAKVELNWMDS